MHKKLWRGLGWSLLLFGALPAAATTRYVAKDNPGAAAPYTDWATAAATIQAAIDAAAAGDQILVSNGCYDAGSRLPPGQTNCPARVVIDKAAHVQSVNGTAFTVIQGQGPRTNTGIRCVWMVNNARLSGFTVTNGHTDASGDAGQKGGGIYAGGASVISNCVITGCEAYDGGGSYYGLLFNCVLRGNSAAWHGGGAGYGTLKNCLLSGNRATFSGGADHCHLDMCELSNNTGDNYAGGAADSTLDNCTLTGNAGSHGGGARDSTLNNCTLSGNSASAWGGGAFSSTLNNCILSGNSAGDGGGTYWGTMNNCTLTANSADDGGGSYYGILNRCTLSGNSALNRGGGMSQSTLNNCLLVGNSAIANAGGAWYGTLNNCTVVGSVNGGICRSTAYNTISYGNTLYNMSNVTMAACYTFDPLFVDELAGNYRLQSNSPCVNTGDNNYAALPTDLDGNTRISGGIVDIGAYEFQFPVQCRGLPWLFLLVQ